MSHVDVRREARLLIVDDHPLFRQGLVVALRAHEGLVIVGEAGSAVEAIAIADQHPLDLAIIDVLMPNMSGLSLALELHERQPACRVLALSVVDIPGLIADMLRAHASGYALKTQPVEEIAVAIEQVLGGVRYLPPAISIEVIDAELASEVVQPFQRLSKREREVFELLIRGWTNADIAAKLFIARRTVETHRQRIMNKLSAHSLAQLLRIVARHGGLPT